MSAVQHAALLRLIHGRRDAVARAWLRLVAPTSFTSLAAVEVQQQFVALTDRFITLLLAEPFDSRDAQSIGAALAKLHYIQPEVIGHTQAVLGSQLIEGLDAKSVAALHPRLVALLSELASGFFRAARDVMLDEQEQIRRAIDEQRTWAMAALRQSEERLRTVVSNVPIVLFAVDRDGIFTVTDGKSLEKLGLAAGALVGQSVFELLREAPAILANLRRALAGEAFSAVVDIADMVFDTRYTPLRDPDGAVAGVIGVAIDITEQRRVEADLTATRQRLAEQGEATRLLLAQELHDQVVQQLISVSYGLADARRRAGDDLSPDTPAGAGLAALLGRLRHEVLDLVTRLRHLIGGLRPDGIDDLGLAAALDGYVARLRREAGQHQPAIELDLEQTERDIPPAVALGLFRAAQEAVRNALRYASARTISLSLRFGPDMVQLQVADDGSGFQIPPSLSQLARAGHYGLIGIAEQISWAGGRLDVDSRPGYGTRVSVWMPLSVSQTGARGELGSGGTIAGPPELPGPGSEARFVPTVSL